MPAKTRKNVSFSTLVLTLLFLMLVLVGLGVFAVSALAGQLEALKPVPVPLSNPQTPEKTELGKKLFFDRRLSGDGTMSCATCHNPAQAFADGLDISLSYPTTKSWRNAPTLLNSAFQQNLFHDGRAKSLEEQALFPIMSAFEMNKNLDYLEEQLRVVPEYVEAFHKVFGGEPTRERTALALAAFERTLLSVNSPLDRFLQGDTRALSEEARKGLEVFQGKGGCVSCHFGVSLSDNSFHALYVPENPILMRDAAVTATLRFVAKVSGYGDYRNLVEDPGRYLITRNQKDWKAFRTPTLREVSRTGPYMHNGIFATLEEVIEFFDRGGGKGNRVLQPLGLTPAEKAQLRSFMAEALTGEEQPFQYPAVP